MTEAFTFRSRDGLSIEAELDESPNAQAGLVLCHPHPKMGGTMNAPLLMAIRDELVARDWSVLRFNFRGIGNSEGTSSTGEAEVADARGALSAMRARSIPVAIAGWSFGAAVAIRTAAQEDDLIGCVAIAPAIDEKPEVTDGVPADVSLSIPTLVVVGANDEQISVPRCREWAEQQGATFNEVPGGNHFFWAKYDDVSALITDWLGALV